MCYKINTREISEKQIKRTFPESLITEKYAKFYLDSRNTLDKSRFG